MLYGVQLNKAIIVSLHKTPEAAIESGRKNLDPASNWTVVDCNMPDSFYDWSQLMATSAAASVMAEYLGNIHDNAHCMDYDVYPTSFEVEHDFQEYCEMCQENAQQGPSA